MKTIIVCTALPMEVKPLCELWRIQPPTRNIPNVEYHPSNSTRIVILTSGIGKDRMKKRINQIHAESVFCWISYGLAGGLVKRFQIGECLFGSSIQTHDKIVCATNPFNMELWKHEVETKLFCSSHVIHTAQMKRQLHQETGADIVDMESIVVLKHAQSRDEPFFWMKSISDTVDHNLPFPLLQCINSDGHPNMFQSFLTLIRNPKLIPSTIRLGVHSSRAAKNLAIELNEIVRRFFL